MIDIKFKGQRLDNAEWVYGCFWDKPLRYGHDPMIYIEDAEEDSGMADTGWVRIDRGTLCRYSGLKDKNGIEIYENDIVKTQNEFIRHIVFKDAAFHVIGENNGEKVSHPLYYQCVLRKDGMIDFEVIGNLYDV